MGGENQPLVLTYGADAKQLEAAMDASLRKIIKTMDVAEARVTGAEKRINAALGGIGRGGAKELGGLENALKRVGNIDPGKALGNIFDRSRLAVIEAGTTKIPLFGSAIEALGPAGLAAAAGIAAFVGAMALAAKSAEWAEELKRTAETLGETTTAVQEWDYAAIASGVPIADMRDGLKGLNEVLGKVQDALTRGQNGIQVKAFDRLGLKPEDLKRYQSASDLLPVIADRIRQVRTAAEQAAILKALGLEQIAPVVKRGGAALLAFKKAAEDTGAVVGSETVEKMAELNDKMKEADQRFSAASKTIGSEFVGALLDIKNTAADAMLAIAKLLDSLPGGDNMPAFHQQIGFQVTAEARAAAIRKGKPNSSLFDGTFGLDSRAREAMAREQDAVAQHAHDGAVAILMQQKADHAALAPALNPTGHDHDGTFTPKAHKTAADHTATDVGEAEEKYLEALIRGATDLDQAHQLRLKLIDQQHTDAVAKALTEKGVTPAGRQKLVDTADLTAQADVNDENLRYAKAQADHARSFGDEMAKLQADQLDAQANITGLLSDRQAVERQRLATEQAAHATDQATRIGDDKNYQSDAGRLEASRLISQQASADLAETDALKAKQGKETADQDADVRLRSLGFDNERLKALEELARSTSARKVLAEQLLANEQQQAEIQLGKTARDKGWSPTDVATERANLALSGRAKQSDLDQQYAGPLAKFARESNGDLGDQLQTQAVTFVKTLNDGLAEAIVDGKTLHDVLKKALKKSAGDLISGGLSRAEGAGINALTGAGGQAAPAAPGGAPGAGSFLSSLSSVTSIFKLFGFAEGTRSAPGGMAIVGEKGPELMHVPRGAAIDSNQTLRSMTGSFPRAGGRSMSVSVNASYDLRGTSGDDAINAKFAQSEARTKAQVMDAVQRSVPGIMAQHQAEAG